MEHKDRKQSHQLFDINQLDGDNKFINTRTKIKNPALGNDTAWEIAQPLLSACVEDYPNGISSDLEPIRKVFYLRRDTFLRKIEPKDASLKVQEVIVPLSLDQQERITGAVVCIRDFFDRFTPYKNFRKFRGSLRKS